jgi:hypothetical protein
MNPFYQRDMSHLMSQTMSDVCPIEAWDGKLDTWDDWYSHWELYSNVLYRHYPNENKLWILLKYLPKNYREIVMGKIKSDGWDYPNAIAYIQQEVEYLDPIGHKMARWLHSKPKEATYQCLQAWFTGWKQLLSTLNLENKLVYQTFQSALHSLFPTAIRDLVEHCYKNPALDLDGRYDFVMQKVRVIDHLGILENSPKPAAPEDEKKSIVLGAVPYDPAGQRSGDKSETHFPRQTDRGIEPRSPGSRNDSWRSNSRDYQRDNSRGSQHGDHQRDNSRSSQ